MRAEVWLQIAAYVTWLASGAPTLLAIAEGRLAGAPAALWLISFLAFAAGFSLCGADWSGRVPRQLKVALLALQAVAAAVVLQLGVSGNGGALFVIVAAELPFVFGATTTFLWMAAQTVLLAALFWRMNGPMTAVVAGGAFGGFQMFAVSTAWLMRSESLARQALARTNAELTATRDLLAENSRVAERLRIARDLHDTLGHHLTALSIQLEVASRLTNGPAASHIHEAHAIAKLLLGEVRDVVGQLRDSRPPDLVEALRELVRAPGGPRVHLQAPDRLEVEDPSQGHALLRCVQELVTNASRHASAQHLWIAIEQGPEGIELRARDDGRGASVVRWGNGLRGMRERFEECAGRLEVETAPGRGFEVRAFLPRRLDAPHRAAAAAAPDGGEAA